jgi:predicted ATP-binding protein involved in virulence|tara:strand:+ start:2070 stop:3680 length:1611 start_codon:yes stop_codon:yes gene_type:complete
MRAIVRKADGGDLKAMYQLALFLKEGRYFEQDEAKSEYYLKEMSVILENSALRVKKLSLTNFRGLKDISVELDPSLTVLVGNNGAGKSAVLDALSMALSWVGENIRKEDRSGVSIREDDISVGEDAHYAAVVADLNLIEDQNFNVMLSRAKEGSREKRDSELVQIKSLAGMFRIANNLNSDFNLPLISHYTVFRSVGVGKSDLINAQKKFENKKWSKLLAYDHALKESHDFSTFLAWLIRFDSAAKQMQDTDISKRINNLEAEVTSLNAFLKKIELEDGDDYALNSLRSVIHEKSKELRELTESYEEKEASFYKKSIQIVFNAINTFMPNLVNFHLDYTGEYIDLKMEKDECLISVLHLSQGEKSLMALVGDIARRLVMLNPGRSDPLQGDGVVMIDEIDLHLHPGWQQKVVGRLQATFPKLQLVLTTHSPQVLSTVRNRNIRVFDRANGSIDTPLAMSYGEESQDVMQSIMGVDPQPPVPEKKMLDELTELVESGQVDNPRVKLLIEKLSNQLSDKHPQIMKIMRSIYRQKALKN